MISRLEYYKFSLEHNKDEQKRLIQPDENVRREDEDKLEVLWSQQTDLEMLALLAIAQDYDRTPEFTQIQAMVFIIRYIADPQQDLRDTISDFVQRYFDGW